jgi:peptidoglycan/xylan/chitin deacetylase (PgdA/CDA1 family)
MVTKNYTAAVRQLRLKHVGWDISARDWCCPTRFEFIAKVAMSNPAGKIILMHDGSGDALTTAQSLDYLIPKMKDAGLRFGTLRSHPGLSFNPHSQHL